MLWLCQFHRDLSFLFYLMGLQDKANKSHYLCRVTEVFLNGKIDQSAHLARKIYRCGIGRGTD